MSQFRTWAAVASMTVVTVTGVLCAESPVFAADQAKTKAATAATTKPISERFKAADVAEVPDFRKHISPLTGKLGCNGRSCHGSFQGAGGLRLSLFGYDFKKDHEALTAQGDNPRVDKDVPEESLIIEKPTLKESHKGGKRYDVGSWQYHAFVKWIKSGAPGISAEDSLKQVVLDITPKEIVFKKSGEKVTLKVMAHWSTGEVEDVTPLCRFQTNNEQVCKIDDAAVVTAADPGDTHVVVFYDNSVVPIPVLRPVSDKIGAKYPAVPTPTKVDELIVQKLRKLGIVPSELCTDEEFLRRASLDITGTLPAPQEILAFVADQSSDKRARKIDELLERPTYAAVWTTLLCDTTGNSQAVFQNQQGGPDRLSQQWYDWIYKRVANNTPYDKLIEGIVVANSRNGDQSYADYCKDMSEIFAKGSEKHFADRDAMPYYWVKRTARQPKEKALGFAYTFLGIRIQCAECHKHPFDQWTQDDFNQFTNFFTRVSSGFQPETAKEREAMLEAAGVDKTKKGNDQRRELEKVLGTGKVLPFEEVYVTKPKGNGNKSNGKGDGRRNAGSDAKAARVLGGEEIDLANVEDPRAALMEWMRRKDNPFFAKAFVNRVWAGYFHQGIVSPTDDLSLANPPCNQELFDYLANGFIEHDFDMKWLHREITNSRAYQMSWKTNTTNQHDTRNFSHAVPRRLPAEVAVDAVRFATSSDEEIAKLHSDIKGRAIGLASTPRNNGNVGSNFALTVFGRSTRESNCDCDRSSEASLLQTVFLHNDAEVFNLIERRNGFADQVSRPAQPAKTATPAKGKKGEAEVKEPANDEKPAVGAPSELEANNAIVRQAYLRTVSRLPTESELSRARQFLETANDKTDGVRGLMWALINTKEFIVNH